MRSTAYIKRQRLKKVYIGGTLFPTSWFYGVGYLKLSKKNFDIKLDIKVYPN